MFILRIEHPVQDDSIWKQIFDSETIQRESSGMQRYQILRPVNGANFAMIDFEFEDVDRAISFHSALKQVWQTLGDRVMRSPGGRIFEVIESKELNK